MLKFDMVLTTAQIQSDQNQNSVAATLTLPYERRIVSRQRVTLDNGQDAGLFLLRGTILHEGDYLKAETGVVVLIKAAAEAVSTLYCDDSLQLTRAAYHLGNRHVQLQIAPGMIRYLHDHVLDDMLRGLGLHVTVEQAPFEPEPGAYGGGHKHSHDDAHGDDHSHNHSPNFDTHSHTHSPADSHVHSH